MAPLYIKGFLPQQNGSAIMLPAEITTIAGSDYDVDKMYFMAPEFELNFDEDRIRKAFKKDRAEKDDVAKDVFSKFHGNNIEALYADLEPNAVATASDVEEFNAIEEEEFKKYYEENKYKHINPKYRFRKVKYNFNKRAKDNSPQARNNLIIDMMWGVLTNPDITPRILNPGGFEYQKRGTRIITILSSSSLEETVKAINKMGIKLGLPNLNDKHQVLRALMRYLTKADLATLDKLADTIKSPIDPLSPLTQIYFHQQNMTGASMIGIYANHNANHALLQHTNVIVASPFMFNNKTLTSLHEIKNREGEYISKNNAGYLAASVDNVKDPVLAALNQNSFTADVTMLLSRLGYNPIEIGILLNQPIVKEMTRGFFRNRRNGVSQETVINKVISRYTGLGGADPRNSKYSNIKDSYKADINELAFDIATAKESVSNNDVEFYRRQLNVGLLFKHMMDVADTLGKIVRATRYDTSKYGAGPTIADTEIKLEAVQNMYGAVKGKSSLIIDPKEPREDEALIYNSIRYDRSNRDAISEVEELREQILNSPIPIVQAFYTLGVRESAQILAPYFPQLSPSFRDVIDAIRGITKFNSLDAKTINSIYNDLLVYIMSKTEFFGPRQSINPDDEGAFRLITSQESRDYFINQFPKDFKNIKDSNPDIAALEFIDRLDVVVDKTTEIPLIVFKNVGRLTPTLRERYMRDWASLLSMKNSEAPKLALNLFRYNYYRNGFAFGPSTFIHLAPTMLRLYIPDYINTLRSILKSTDDYGYFINQYIYNHLDNRKLVPEIPSETTVKFAEENGTIKDEVTFVIENTSSEADKKVVKTFPTGSEKEYEFMKFIGTRVNNKWVYYTLVDRLEMPELADNVAVYRRIEPLGLKNNFLEYEYGVGVEEVTSVIKAKSDDIDPYSGTSAVHFSADSTPEYKENPMEDAGYYESVSDSVLEALGIKKSTDAADSKNMTSIEANENYTDAEGKPTCG